MHCFISIFSIKRKLKTENLSLKIKNVESIAGIFGLFYYSNKINFTALYYIIYYCLLIVFGIKNVCKTKRRSSSCFLFLLYRNLVFHYYLIELMNIFIRMNTIRGTGTRSRNLRQGIPAATPNTAKWIRQHSLVKNILLNFILKDLYINTV